MPRPASSCSSPGGEVVSDSPADDSWELDQHLAHIERVLNMGATSGSGRSEHTERQEVARLDSAHRLPTVCHQPPGGRRHRKATAGARRPSVALAVLTWTALALGTTTFVCGGMLLGWSIVSGRPELWNLGLPIALGGQIALLVGLVLQLDRLWHDSRHAAAKLDDVDEQLHELKTATTMLGTSHSSPGSSFYCHLSSGASPQLLLTDLKSQLDLLALRIDQEQRRAGMPLD